MIRKVWDIKDSGLPLVVKDASWRFIHDFSDFQTCKGVFVFANASHHIKYVGKTIDNCMVEAIADAMESGKDLGATLVKVLYTQVDKDAKLVADVLIEKYSPTNNSNNIKTERKIITGSNRVL